MPISLQHVAAIVSTWAKAQRTIRTVWFFGSRVKGTNNEESDLDIAIEIIFTDPNAALAHWMCDQDRWLAELAGLVPLRLDLQLYHPESTHTIVRGLQEAAMKVFEREF